MIISPPSPQKATVYVTMWSKQQLFDYRNSFRLLYLENMSSMPTNKQPIQSKSKVETQGFPTCVLYLFIK